MINGANIKDYTKDSIIKLYSVVFQDFKIFSTTLKENVCASGDFDEGRFYACLEKRRYKGTC
ncbi:MAG: hypothetical protein L6V88_11710 [Anaerotruncus sp.]|nr:MAG: hypothetical protein L6V88_11710 [Anaerotruncus sp.]